MNYIIHLNKAFALFCEDERLTPFHVSLYFSLFQYWNMAKFRNPISISRDELMRASKIGSVNTYIRSIKDLHSWNYIKYIPSYNPQKGSQVYLYTFDNSNNNTNDNSLNNGSDIPPDNANKKATGKANEKPVIPSINSSNKTNKQNNKNDDEHKRKKNNQNSDLVITKIFVNEQGSTRKRKKVAPKKENRFDSSTAATTNQKSEEGNSKKNSKVSRHRTKTPAKKKTKKVSKASAPATRFKRPLLLTVKNYFKTRQWTALEAEKFFNYYQGNGWLVGGKTPMQSWQACAANWIINSEKFNNGKTKSVTSSGVEKRNAGKLNASTGKDYSEPL